LDSAEVIALFRNSPPDFFDSLGETLYELHPDRRRFAVYVCFLVALNWLAVMS
jgi:hypothetical protein